MPTAAVPERPSTVLADAFTPHRLTVASYERIVEAGILGEDEPIFLWQGSLVEKMGRGNKHLIATTALYRFFVLLLPPEYHARQEQPIAIGDDSMPEPDLAVLRGPLGDYYSRSATERDALLLVEIADSSLRVDSGTKRRVYAASGIPAYWIVNLRDARVEVYTDPSGPTEAPTYSRRQDFGPGDAIPIVLDGRDLGRLAVADLLL